MSETIETFVKKLQQDGVDAGRVQAEKITAEAEEQAEKIVTGARQQAEKIVEEAKEKAERIAAAQANELRLAARDALLKLREGVAATIEGVLRRKTAEHLEQEDVLKELIQQIVKTYAEEGTSPVSVTVNQEAFEKIGDWALKEITSDRVDLQGTLKGLGFEYSVGDATVEVTVDSVVEVLNRMVSARLQKVLAEAGRD